MPAPQPSAPVTVSQEELDKLIKFYSEVQSGAFSKAAGYHQIIVGAGYAGAFALWNVVKGQLSPVASNWIVLSIGVSLTFFIAWNVYGMIWLAIEQQRYFSKTAGKVGAAYIEAYRQAELISLRNYREHFLPLWRYQLPITIVTAVIGLGILLVNVAINLLNID